MTLADRARTIHAANPRMSVAAIARRLGTQPSKVRNALSSAPRRSRVDSLLRRVLLTPALSRALHEEAAATGRPIAGLIREAIRARYESTASGRRELPPSRVAAGQPPRHLDRNGSGRGAESAVEGAA